MDSVGAPPLMQASPDWKLRSDYQPSLMRSGYRRGRRKFDELLRDRLWNTSLHFRLPYVLDVAYARRAEEYHYACSLATFRLADADTDPGPKRSELLLYSTTKVLPGRTDLPTERTPEQGLTTQRLTNTPHSWTTYERIIRSRTDVLVAAQYREVVALDHLYTPLRYVSLPTQWQEYEAPCCLAVRTPQVVTYHGIDLLKVSDFADQLWNFFRIEWAHEFVVEMLYECRRGWLVWMPPYVLKDVGESGVAGILRDAPEQVLANVEAMLKAMERIRWSMVPSEQRTLPDVIDDFTPVFAGGDRVKWDPVSWKPLVSADLLMPVSASGEPLEVDDRGPRLSGCTAHLAQEGFPNGRGLRDNPPRSEPSASGSQAQGGSGKSMYGLSRRNLAYADNTLVGACADAGITEALKSFGLRGRPCIRDIVAFLEDLTKNKRILKTSGEEFAKRCRDSFTRDEDGPTNRPNKKPLVVDAGRAISNQPLDNTVTVVDEDNPGGNTIAVRTQRYVYRRATSAPPSDEQKPTSVGGGGCPLRSEVVDK